jgi:hypothetical protein
VELKNPKGEYVHPTLHSKDTVLEEVAKIIPVLESRKARIAHFEQMRREHEERQKIGPGKAAKKKEKEKAKAAKKKGGNA